MAGLPKINETWPAGCVEMTGVRPANRRRRLTWLCGFIPWIERYWEVSFNYRFKPAADASGVLSANKFRAKCDNPPPTTNPVPMI